MPPKQTFTRPEESAELTMDQLQNQLEGMSTDQLIQEYNLVLKQAINPKRETKRSLNDLKTQVLQKQMDQAQKSGDQAKVLDTQNLIKRGLEFQAIDDIRDAKEQIDALINPQLDVYRAALAKKITSAVIAERKLPSESMALMIKKIEEAKLSDDLKLIHLSTQLVFSAEMNELNDKVVSNIKKVPSKELEAKRDQIKFRADLSQKLPQDAVLTIFLGTDLFSENSQLFQLLSTRLSKGKLQIRKVEEFSKLIKPMYQQYLTAQGLNSSAFNVSDDLFLKLLKDHQMQARLDEFNQNIVGPDGLEVQVQEPANRRVQGLEKTRGLLLREEVRLKNRKSTLLAEGKTAEAEQIEARIKDIQLDAARLQNAITSISTVEKTTRHEAIKSSSLINFAPGIRADFRGNYGKMNTGVMKKSFNAASDAMDYVADKALYYIGEPKPLGDMQATDLAIYAGMSAVSLGFLVGISQGLWGTVQSIGSIRNPKKAMGKFKDTVIRSTKSLVVPSLLVGAYVGVRDNYDSISKAVTGAAKSFMVSGRRMNEFGGKKEAKSWLMKQWEEGKDVFTGNENFWNYLETEYKIKPDEYRKHFDVQDNLEESLQYHFVKLKKEGKDIPDLDINTTNFNQLIIEYKLKVKMSGKDPEAEPQQITLDDLKSYGVITAEQFAQLQDALPEDQQFYTPKPGLSRRLVDQSHWYAANFLTD